MAHMRRIAPLVALVATLVLAPSASASHGCSKHAKGGKVTHKTKESHVFEKKNRWWGCTTKTGRPYVLPGLDTITAREFDDGTVPTHITLSGVFVAYERYTLHPAGGAGDTQTDIYVVDLRNGKVVVDEDARPQTETYDDRYVSDLVLKRNGSVGWTSTHWRYPPGSTGVVNYEVHRFSRDPASAGRALLDSGADIDRESLALSADRKTMTWTKGGQTKSAALP
jgi:hypothetical protein